MQTQTLARIFRILMILVLVVVILVYAKPFLVPLVFAGLFAMLLLPITRWLQARGLNQVVSILISILVLIAFFGLLIAFISWQVSDLAGDASKMEGQLTKQVDKLRAYLSNSVGIPPQEQQKIMKQQQEAAPGQASAFINSLLSGIGTFLTNTVLVLVYIFLFQYFRGHIRQFILKLVPRDETANTVDIMHSAQKVTQKYLTGLSLMIFSLWVMYGIGFTMVGVKNAVFFAILCGMLEIVPFVGNLVGTALTVAMSLVQGGDTQMVLGILATYAMVQFIQTYILEPLVVGAEVNINPLFTILGIVAGEMLWGIPGMILAIPLMGITKIVCDHVTPLKPFGFLIGESKKKQDKGITEKIKGWFR
jgi:predicted PurR-regulated permease PerM